MIVFDLDDTLYLERDFAFSGYRHLDRRVHETCGTAGFGATCMALYESGERQRIFDRACAQLGVQASADFIQNLVAAYRAHPPEIELCPDAIRFLARAKGPFGLISDGPAHMQRNKLAALALIHRIAHIRLTGDWPPGFGKPHPRAFEEMEARATGKTPMIYIADNPAKDFVTPAARGWHTVQITRAGGVHDPTPPGPAHAAARCVTTLDDLDDHAL